MAWFKGWFVTLALPPNVREASRLGSPIQSGPPTTFQAAVDQPPSGCIQQDPSNQNPSAVPLDRPGELLSHLHHGGWKSLIRGEEPAED
ncbi:MAG: hypothetical protein CMN96_01605 [Synechococcus sp. MED850]|nr:hypothetical protein [Synechococcus sp. MED850]OUW99099.1 MAG: hypothetical protein CBD89_01055 [Cyanobacteria bacterium TMED229]